MSWRPLFIVLGAILFVLWLIGFCFLDVPSDAHVLLGLSVFSFLMALASGDDDGTGALKKKYRHEFK